MATRLATTGGILDRRVSVDIECLDRIFLNGNVPNVATHANID
jgi:hypothetical protein